MDKSWETDERLHGMDTEKLKLLSKFAAELGSAPKENKMSAFLELNRKMNQSGLTFTPSEQELLFVILTENLPPEEQKKARLIRTLAGRMRNPP